MKSWQIVAVIGALLWIGIGAKTGHQPLPVREAIWLEKAQRYHIVHVLALLWFSSQLGFSALPAWFWLIGVLCFSGSLYFMALMHLPLNKIVPIGGIAMMLGWAHLLWQLISKK